MKKTEKRLLVGASIPSGIAGIKDFLKLKLGDMVLTTLPDDKKEAKELMRLCRENHIHVLLSELMKRGSFDRWHCPSFSKKDFDEIISCAGDYYMGRYTIGEAGGVLYWPKAYTIKRRAKSYENLPKFESAEEAHSNYVEYLRKYISYEREKVGGGRLFNVESSMLFNYHAEAGIDAFCLEMLPGDPFRVMPAIRGNARAFSKEWGVHIAMGWYGGVQLDELWFKRWKLSLYYSFMSGAESIFPESGYYEHACRRENKTYEFSHPKMKASRAVLRDFWRFSSIHKRAKAGPDAKIAVIFGHNEGCPGVWNPYAWGQYGNGEKWEEGPAEKGWNLLDSFHRSENCFSESLMASQGHSFSGNPPSGQIDIVPAESALAKLKNYKCLVFIGWNNMTDELYKKLTEYVKGGGHLLMWLSHFNVEKKRGEKIRLFNNGDLKELFGVEIKGAEKADVTGVKYLRASTLDAYRIPFRGTRKDPVFIGRMTPAKVHISNRRTSVLCAFSEFCQEELDELDKRPALIEKRLGKGHAFLVTAFDHPGDDGMKKFAENVLRIISTGEQGELELLCSDSVRYSVYSDEANGKKFRVIYVLNTEFDVSQAFKISINGKLSEELIIPANEMRIVLVVDSVVISPAINEFSIQSIKACNGSLKIDLYSLEKQSISVSNISRKALEISVNGIALRVGAYSSGKIECDKKEDPDKRKFYRKDFMREPIVKMANSSLPY